MSESSDKNEKEPIFRYINEAQRILITVQSSSIHGNNTIDITAINSSDEIDRPDPMRLTEVIIVICVLLLWCASIFIFIRHSQLLRIRHRGLPYRSSMKPPMNLNRVTVVHRTSDMVIHSKPRLTSPAIFRVPPTTETTHSPSTTDEPKKPFVTTWRNKETSPHSFDSNSTAGREHEFEDRLLNPRMISDHVRRRLLDLHRKSMENLAGIRYSISYSTNDVSQRQKRHDQYLSVDVRCVQESPL